VVEAPLLLALLANAKLDGYALCGATDSGIIRPPQLQKVTCRPLKDFTPLHCWK
jgi:hypothetical protein